MTVNGVGYALYVFYLAFLFFSAQMRRYLYKCSEYNNHCYQAEFGLREHSTALLPDYIVARLRILREQIAQQFAAIVNIIYL